MEEQPEASYFSAGELYAIAALVNEKIKKVTYHYWVNKASQEVFEVLDWISLDFESGNTITFTGGLDSDGIKIVAPDFEQERLRLEEEFGGKVSIEARNASGNKVWKETIGKEITPSVIKMDEKVMSDSLGLKFNGADDLVIFLGLEGLEVDYLEDDQEFENA
jgi:hypothetical protein